MEKETPTMRILTAFRHPESTAVTVVSTNGPALPANKRVRFISEEYVQSQEALLEAERGRSKKLLEALKLAEAFVSDVQQEKRWDESLRCFRRPELTVLADKIKEKIDLCLADYESPSETGGGAVSIERIMEIPNN